MPTYLHPGVYVEEVSGGARPIEAVGTSTAAFVGIAERGPIDEPRFITNFTEFQQIYGGYLNDDDLGASYLAYSVFHFFQNGGTACYVVRVEKDAKPAGVELDTGQGVKTLTIRALSPGAWGNGLRIAIKSPGTTTNGFNMYVFMKDEMVEAYEDLSMVDTSTAYVDRVTKRSLYIRTQSEDLPDKPTCIGKKDLTGTKPNLSNVCYIKLQVDTFGPYTIDCSAKAGAKGAVDPQEICDAINAAFLNDVQGPVADVYTDLSGRRHIRIQSPTANERSKIIFTQPDEKDATEDIFGLVESSWEVKSDDVTPENNAIAYGRKDLSSTTIIASPNNITFQHPTTGADLTAIDVSGTSITIWDIVKKINDATLSGQPLEPLAPAGRKLAWTDGRYLVLKTDKDIRIKRRAADKSAIENIFGTGFYAHTFTGSGTNPAKITGKALGSFPAMTQDKNYMRIKVDTSPTIVVDLNGTTSFEDVAERINDKFYLETKKKDKIAEVKTTGANKQLALVSGTQGDTSRLILLNSIEGEDAAIPLLLGNEADITLGTGTTKQEYFLIIADKPLRAMLKSDSPNLASDFAGRKASVLNKSLRFTVDERTIEIEGSSIPTATTPDLKAIFGAFSGPGKEPLRQRLLTDGVANIDLVPFVTGAKTYLRFSIPLLGTGTAQESDVHAEAVAKDTINAYRGIFGDTVSVFQGPSKELTVPMYTYEYGLPDNNPGNTVLMTGEELDFSQSLALSGGSQSRSSESDIKNLTIGSVAGVTSGLRLLDKLTDISLLVIPGWERMSKDTAKAFTDEGTTYCDKVRPAQARPLRDLFFITNTPVEVTDPVAAKNFVMTEINYKSSGGYEAIYYPWIEVNDPIGTKSTSISIPPAGSVAGLYASIDGRRGVWKAPAGTEAGVAGVVKLADQVNDIKQDLLNPFGVNAIRRMPGSGIVSWGARTLCTNPEWKYIPVRRTAIMLEVSIYEGIQWAVFEPNDEPLWSLLRLNIGAFMMNLFRSGAFQGSTPDEAFFVKCDKETTTQVEIDLGKVIILVGFAPLKPAEFVIVRISQKAGKKE